MLLWLEFFHPRWPVFGPRPPSCLRRGFRLELRSPSVSFLFQFSRFGSKRGKRCLIKLLPDGWRPMDLAVVVKGVATRRSHISEKKEIIILFSPKWWWWVSWWLIKYLRVNNLLLHHLLPDSFLYLLLQVWDDGISLCDDAMGLINSFFLFFEKRKKKSTNSIRYAFWRFPSDKGPGGRKILDNR